MLTLIVGFQDALAMRGVTRLADFIHSLRAQLLPQSFQNKTSIQVSNRMLLLSDEAIYIFEYLALMREPAHDYLSSVLNHIYSNVDSLVPAYVLELQEPCAQISLTALLQKIARSGHLGFLATMLRSLT